MSTEFVVALGSAVILVVAARFLHPALPIGQRAITLTWPEVALTIAGVAALGFHCSAMFFTRVADRLPGLAGAVEDIRALGTSSLVWYVVPALLVVLGLRRLPPLALIAVCLALVAIGVTMYAGSPLQTHLRSIFVGVVLLAITVAALIRPPRSGAGPA